jgi:transposase InsO family protein
VRVLSLPAPQPFGQCLDDAALDRDVPGDLALRVFRRLVRLGIACIGEDGLLVAVQVCLSSTEPETTASWNHSLPHARVMLETWRRDYNAERPHSSLVWQTPLAFTATWRQGPCA